MDTPTKIVKFKEFIQDEYLPVLLEKTRVGEYFIAFDFKKISRFDIELAEDLIDDPEETLKAAEIAIDQFDLPAGKKDIRARIKNLPKSQSIMIRDIRSEQIGKFLSIEGVVRQKSDVRPQVTSSRYECPSCGTVIPVLQLDSKLKEPTACSCGRKGKFRLMSKELVDAQSITFEECIERLEGGEQPKKIKVFLKEDLVSPISDKRTNPGTKLILNGYVKEVPVMLRSGGQSTLYDLMIEANYIEPLDEDFGEIKITKKEEEHIQEIASDKQIIHRLIKSVAPTIHGHDRIKEALLLQLVGGVKKIEEDGVPTRGDMHILLIGDPGAGKSKLLKRIDKISPKSRFISGKGASGAGLTATVVKDDFMGGWALEAGALVLANKGLICLDELDKISKEDTSAMHEALEGQTVTISKANIQATMICETSVLAAANPKFGRFDPYSKTIFEQIELPSTLINRFDLIFPIKDIPDSAKDEELANFLINKHKNNSKQENGEIPTDMLRKYLAYAKKKQPEITDEAQRKLVQYYLNMRSKGIVDGTVKSIPISARQLEGLVRMSEAYAKLKLSSEVTKDDAVMAISLMDYCLRQIAWDEESGTVDIDRIATSTASGERNTINAVKHIIEDLTDKLGKTVPIDDVVKEAAKKNISEDKVDEAIEKLKRSGDVMEPRRGFIQRM